MKTILRLSAVLSLLFACVAVIAADPKAIDTKAATNMMVRLNREHATLLVKLTNTLARAESSANKQNRAAYAEFRQEAREEEMRNGPRVSYFGATTYHPPASAARDPAVIAVREKIAANRSHYALLEKELASQLANDPKAKAAAQEKRAEAVKKFRAEQAATPAQ